MSCRLPRELIDPTDELDFTAVEEQHHFVTTCHINTPVEAEYYGHGGILHKVLRDLVKA